MTDKKTISVLLEPEVVEELTKLQSKYEVFSRSKLLREIIKHGLKAAESELSKR
jgi:metal-responsive CopG/Arc/MetJ family transcriptional regulator